MPVSPPADEPSRGIALKAAFRDFITDPAIDIPDATNPLHGMLAEHFGADPLSLPTTAVQYSGVRQVGYQLAMNEFLSAPGRTHEVTGLCFPSGNWSSDLTLATILSPPSFAFVAPVLSPVDYEALPSGFEEILPCFGQALALFDGDTGPGVLWIYRDTLIGQTVCEVMAPTIEQGEAVLRELYEGSVRLNPYRGQLLELLVDSSMAFGWGLAQRGPVLSFRERPRPLQRDDVILPAGLLDQIERHSIGVVKAHDVLRATGRHLKRGLLLHGRPGTGKTHTIKYLIGQLPNATVLWLSASRMYNLRYLRQVVDVVVPGVIVLDDVDLIAEDRSLGAHGPLFELLDVLDGIAEDQDILFLLTTNRPDEIEPAIAARPGRVDQAIGVPLPDAGCRRQLFELYAAKVRVCEIAEDDLATFIDRTEGVTASFIREVLRRATVAFLESGQPAPVTITGAGLLRALDELLDPENPLTPLLLGAVPKHALPVIPLNAEDRHVIHS